MTVLLCKQRYKMTACVKTQPEPGSSEQNPDLIQQKKNKNNLF